MVNSAGRPIAPLVLSSVERAYLERQIRRRRVARSLSERVGSFFVVPRYPEQGCCSQVRRSRTYRWQVAAAFLEGSRRRSAGRSSHGRPRTIDVDQVAAVIECTLRSTPADATHWSIRPMAGATGFSHTTTRRIWTAFGLQLHRSETFKCYKRHQLPSFSTS